MNGEGSYRDVRHEGGIRKSYETMGGAGSGRRLSLSFSFLVLLVHIWFPTAAMRGKKYLQ